MKFNLNLHETVSFNYDIFNQPKLAQIMPFLDNFDQIIGQKLVCLDSSWTDSLNCDCMKQFIEVYDEFD